MEGMLDLPLAPQPANNERRRAQNRRSQAAFRERQRQRIHELERQLSWLQECKKRWPARLDLDRESSPWFGGPPGEGGGGGEVVSRRQPSLDVGRPRSLSEWDDELLSTRDSSLSLSSPSDTPTLREYQLADLRFPVSQLPTPRLTPGSLPLAIPEVADKRLTHALARTVPDGRFEQQQQQQQHQLQHRTSAPRLISTLNAMVLNALLLGIPEIELITVGAVSDFYAPLKRVQQYHRLPDSLKPTPAQKAFPHPRFIDCIPIPAFRSRVIYAMSAQPPLIDEYDLLHDILSGGMFCSAGVAADPANWQMSPLFTQQWQNLLSIDFDFLEGHALLTGRSFGFNTASAGIGVGVHG